MWLKGGEEKEGTKRQKAKVGYYKSSQHKKRKNISQLTSPTQGKTKYEYPSKIAIKTLAAQKVNIFARPIGCVVDLKITVLP